MPEHGFLYQALIYLAAGVIAVPLSRRLGLGSGLMRGRRRRLGLGPGLRSGPRVDRCQVHRRGPEGLGFLRARHDPRFPPHAREGLRDADVVRVGLRGPLEVLDRRCRVPGAKVEERDALERAGAHRVEAQSVGPGVERPGQVPLIAQDSRQEVVRISQARIPAEPTARHLAGGLELSPASKRLGELQEREAGGLVGHPCREAADIVTHDSDPALASASPPRVACARRRLADAGPAGRRRVPSDPVLAHEPSWPAGPA